MCSSDLADEEAARRADEEAAAKLAKEAGKKAKEEAKKAVKKNRRVLKASVKDNNYFVATAEPAPTPAAIDGALNDVDLIQGKIDPDELAELVATLTVTSGAAAVKAVYAQQAQALVAKGAVKKEDFKVLLA